MVVTTERRRRAHVVLPDELVKEVDEHVGQRRRSRFIQEAVEEKLGRRQLKTALAEMNGALAGVEIPGWETPESAVEWVRSLRREEESGGVSSDSAA